MTLNDFKTLVETYGARSARWPDDQRDIALAFMQNQKADCESVLQAERGLDDLLEGARLSPGTDILKARIMSSIETEPSQADDLPQTRGRVIRGFGHKAMAALMLLSFTLGFGGASVLKLPAQNEGPDNYIASEATSDNDTNEWAELADDYGLGDIYDWVDTEDTGLNAP